MDLQIEDSLMRLSKSKFRNSFHLRNLEKDYVQKKGFAKIKEHAYDFVNQRLAAKEILNDGKQTPMKGHPVFIAQHATATCCRGCLMKWHHIPNGMDLNSKQKEYIVKVIMTWISKEMKG